MNAKKCGWLFLVMLLVEGTATFLIALFSERISMGIIASLIFSQLIILLPTVVFVLAAREPVRELIPFARPKLSTTLLVIVFSYLCMPLIVTVNAISMLFVENEVISLQGYLTNVPAWQTILIVGVLGPVSEEFVFRGVLYHGFRKSGRIVGAMLLSALLFGLTHLNFNQMSYAVVMGVIGVLLIEGTGSIFYSMLLHICINMTNAVEMAFMDADEVTDMGAAKQMVEQTMNMPYKQALCVAISVMAVFAFVMTLLAACLFYAIAKRENRAQHIHDILHPVRTSQERTKLFSVPLVIAILLCLAVMILDVWMTGM